MANTILDFYGLKHFLALLKTKFATADVATETSDGLMSRENKIKLDGIEVGANKIVIDSVLSSVSSNPVENKTVTIELENKIPNTRTINGKDLIKDIVLTADDVGADTKGSAEIALRESQQYTKEELAKLIGSAPETMDTIEELASCVEENKNVIEILNDAIGNKANRNHTHTISEIEELQDVLDDKLNSEHTHTVDSISGITEKILQVIYPIGSVYISVQPNNPESLYGFGTWQKIEDTFLLASGTTYPIDTTGGEANHTLSINEIPSHSHEAYTDSGGAHTHKIGTDRDASYDTGGGCWSVHNASSGADYMNGATSSAGNHSHTVTVSNTGNGYSHNNMPPYITVYVWKRIS